MQAIAELEKQWRERARFRRLNTGPTIEGDGVVLGSDTVLAKRHSDGALNSNDARTLTLLAVAYGRPVERSVLRKLELASRHAQSGNEAMASMHIALAGLPLLSPDDARRLFIADGLIERGVALRDIWAALEFDPAPLDALERYDPDEARVPAGSGRPSGRWARDGAEALEGPQPSPPPITPSPPAPTAAARALELAGAAARAVARIAARYAPKLLDKPRLSSSSIRFSGLIQPAGRISRAMSWAGPICITPGTRTSSDPASRGSLTDVTSNGF